ncbi:putative hydrolase [Sphingomonas changbaiensis NBRC 104936]|uniref:Putative hydrolase n=1 Tax=Sphingomonas changbaiensis NBRC 104936 TaxID=1219043 RepID=A0A0E9MSG6_9SPHN|nr:cell wall hydrolase [Sphingomonas changbaiensis]GAO40075.1 putative hydrolase [Sphingomonas changbaiensis NBRC 104936]
MSRIYRAASLAAVTFCTAFGIAFSAPSFAETVSNAVSVISNDQNSQPVPAVAVEPLPEVPATSSDSAISAAPAGDDESGRIQAKSLDQLVSQQDMPETLDRETECLAASVYFESKGEPLEGQLAVAEVVLNRAKAGGHFPPSVCSVVFQKGQFSFVHHGHFPPIKRGGAFWKTAVAIAQIAMDDEWDSRASKALYFHAARVSPGWNKVRVAQLGNHVFYR